MQAIILAAGMGKRLGALTSNNTKCMVEVNGTTLIKRMLKQLDNLRPHLSRIVIAIGYEGEKLKDYISTLDIATEIHYVVNKDFATTNNIVSLALTKDWLVQEDTLLLESDLIFEDSVLEELVRDCRPTLALVDKYTSGMDGTVVKIDEDDNILACVPGKKFVFKDIPNYYKTVNIYKFSKEFSGSYYVPFLEAYCKAYGNNEYHEQVLRVLIMIDDSGIKAKRLNGQLWYEIDDIQDLDIASSLFTTNPKEQLEKFQERYGGYWRYPNLLDFCYLVNPYYPPPRLCNEMKANFNKLIAQYPSGAKVNSLLAAKNFSVSEDYVVVGNGAAEIIASLLRFVDTPIGLIKPTFEEYVQRAITKDTKVFVPSTKDFSYGATDIIEHFDKKNIASLVLINPDNPSGNYLPRKELDQVLDWAKSKSITLILDESFADFSDELNNSCIDDRLLKSYPNLIVIKSISKSYGVPGVRLGIMVTANLEILALVKKDVAIWNINSFGEFYLQIAEKYKNDYVQGLNLFRAERKRFFDLLSAIKGLEVMPSQANYFMVELTNNMSVQSVAETLLKDWNILVKDLTKKLGSTRQVMRIAIRNSTDNNTLVEALKNIIK